MDIIIQSICEIWPSLKKLSLQLLNWNSNTCSRLIGRCIFFFLNSNFILFWHSSYGSSPIRACLQHSCINTLFKETQSKFWYLFVHKQNSLSIKSWRKKNLGWVHKIMNVLVGICKQFLTLGLGISEHLYS